MTEVIEKNGASEEEVPTMKFLKLKFISPSELNPRKEFDEAELQELAKSIKKIGLIQAIVVRPQKTTLGHEIPGLYEIVCGERRYRASEIAGLKLIPASIRNLTDQEAMELMITENLQRKDVHPLEESDAFNMMLEKMQYSILDIAAKVGKPETFVYRRLQLQKLNAKLRPIFQKGELPIGHAELLSRIPSADQDAWHENKFSASWGGGPGTIAELQRYLTEKVEHKLSEATFDTTDSVLLKTAGSCLTCHKNSAVSTNLFPDKADAAICHDRRCFEAKKDAHFEVELKKALEDPDVILIDESYGSDKHVIAKLKKEGYSILKRWDDYEPNNNTFADKKKGAPKKAFHVAGINRGSYCEIFLKLNKGVGAKLNEHQGVLIQREELQQKLKRGRELDDEKILKELLETMESLPFIKEPEGTELTPALMNAVVVLAYGSSGNHKQQAFELLGFEGHWHNDTYKGPQIVEAIAKTPAAVKAWLIKVWLLNLFTSNPHPGSIYGAACKVLAQEWCPQTLLDAQHRADENREKREAKINKQLEDLETQIEHADAKSN